MDKIVTETQMEIKGIVKRWEILNSDGSIAEACTIPSDNLILDQGMDMPATNLWANLSEYCAVGTGTAAPAQTDTGLVNENARTSNTFSANTDTIRNTSFGLEYRRTFQFPVGSLDSAIDGVYGELGFSPNSVAGNNLFSRTLFRDGSGNAITVTINSDQSLRVTYSLFVQPGPTLQTSSSASITNIGTVNFTHMVQNYGQLNTDNSTGWTDISYLGMGRNSDAWGSSGWFEPSVSESGAQHTGIRNDVYTFASYGSSNNLGRIGTAFRDGFSVQSYTAGNYYVDYDVVFDPATFGGNTVTTFVAYAHEQSSSPAYVLVIDSADRFIKPDTDRLTLTFRLSWSRA